jgi:hypothetical protein
MKINTTNYEEYFLLYIDNELSADQKTAVNLFIEENPIYKKEWTQLQQTILIPEPIEFEDKVLLYRLDVMEASLPTSFKQSLYREETKVIKGFFGTKAITIRYAIAAIFLLLVGYKIIPTISGVQNTHQELVTNSINGSNKNVVSIINNPPNTINNAKISTISNLNTVPSIGSSKSLNNIQKTIIQTTEPDYSLIMNNQTGITNTYVTSSAQDIVPSSIAMNTSNEVIKNISPEPAEKNVNSEGNMATESIASFENINTDNPDRTIYIANMEIDGDRLRGITRRIGAFIKRNKTEK